MERPAGRRDRPPRPRDPHAVTESGIERLIADLRRDPEYDKAVAVVALVREAGDLLQQMRERAGLRQTDLAKCLEITPGRVSQLESGTLRHAPSLRTLALWAHACGAELTLRAQMPTDERAEDRPAKGDVEALEPDPEEETPA